MSVKIYVEGGGDSKLLQVQCRAGFRKLFERAGFEGRMPAVVACGGRQSAYDRFRTATSLGSGEAYPMLLVDSEDPVASPDGRVDAPEAWNHLASRDGWSRPPGVRNDQAQLMATCMETWIVADRGALQEAFGSCLRVNALPPVAGLELRSRHDLQDRLEKATRDCGRDKAYRKGRRSFQVLQCLDPEVLKPLLLHFRRLLHSLEAHLLDRRGDSR